MIDITAHSTPIGEALFYTITNSRGARVVLSTLGAGIVSIAVPDKDGKLTEVALGYKNAGDYFQDGPCMGKIPGRFANRIAKGKFSIDGTEYRLAINNGPNALHGGPTGFQNRIWEAKTEGDNAVVFSYSPEDGEEGYPGKLYVKATYTWTDDCELRLHLEATSDAATVVNLTNHAYFNLDGATSGTVLNHKLTLKASHYLPTDDTQIPTGEIAPVEGTPMDFTKAKEIGKDIHADFHPLKVGKGYDHCWVIDDYQKGKLQSVALLEGVGSGIKMEVLTTQPGMQVYTGNWLEGCPQAPDGYAYHDYDGVAIECQGFPDAPNHSEFPSSLLRPGEHYDETIVFKFA